jgi:hypothetical protein
VHGSRQRIYPDGRHAALLLDILAHRRSVSGLSFAHNAVPPRTDGRVQRRSILRVLMRVFGRGITSGRNPQTSHKNARQNGVGRLGRTSGPMPRFPTTRINFPGVAVCSSGCFCCITLDADGPLHGPDTARHAFIFVLQLRSAATQRAEPAPNPQCV